MQFAPIPSGASGSENMVYTFAGLNEVGRSQLVRRPDRGEISMEIYAEGLTTGYTYTIWWVVFDQPQRCSPEAGDATNTPMCGEDDVFEDALAGGTNLPEVSILGAADGKRIDADRMTYFSGSLDVGDASQAIFGDGLDNVGTAELHLVIRSHGPAIPELLKEQITTFNGGCTGAPAELGTPGPNTCEDVQFSVHLPPVN